VRLISGSSYHLQVFACYFPSRDHASRFILSDHCLDNTSDERNRNTDVTFSVEPFCV
jgi:hypothetical protein